MFDGLQMKHVVKNIQPLIINCKIDKIYHPEEKLLLLKINTKDRKKQKLLISCDPSFCSVQFTHLNFENPTIPSTFCMVLRKHLEGTMILDIKQLGLERLIALTVQGYNDLGEATVKTLHLELMGKYSNIILTENDTIIDALYKYPIGVNGYREILPKRTYQLPPLSNKVDPRHITEEELSELIMSADDQSQYLYLWLQERFEGFSKETMKALLHEKSLDTLSLENLGQIEISKIYQLFQGLNISINRIDLNVLDESEETYTTYYLNKKITSQKQRFNQILLKEKKKLLKKHAIYQSKIDSGDTSDTFKMKGELLSANIYKLKGGEPSIQVENYFTETLEPITISLDPSLTPSGNVKKYFKRYHKIKEGRNKSIELLAAVNDQIDYIDSILHSVERVTSPLEFPLIESELKDYGLIQSKKIPKKKKISKKKEVTLNVEKYESPEGFIYYIGKNNKENDFITFKLGRGNDLWFHIKDYPGAHVLMKNPDQLPLTDEAIEKGAELAFINSKGHILGRGDVDYTFKKYVKKHPSHLLGKVIYTDYKTLHFSLEK